MPSFDPSFYKILQMLHINMPYWLEYSECFFKKTFEGENLKQQKQRFIKHSKAWRISRHNFQLIFSNDFKQQEYLSSGTGSASSVIINNFCRFLFHDISEKAYFKGKVYFSSSKKSTWKQFLILVDRFWIFNMSLLLAS